MPADYLTYPGAVLRLSHVAEADQAPTISQVRAYIYPLDSSTAVVSGAAGGFTNGVETGKSEYWYDWTPDPAFFIAALDARGDFVYRLGRLIGTEWRYQSGTILLWPFFSKLDRYLERIKSLVAESRQGEDLQTLSLRDYRDAFSEAVSDYSADNPRRVLSSIPLSSGQWEYDLSGLSVAAAGGLPAAAWAPRFSSIVLVEPRVNDTQQVQFFTRGSEDVENQQLQPWGWAEAAPLSSGETVDEQRGKFRFTWWLPSTGDTARVWWTALHSVTHTADSLPQDPSGVAVDFDPLCRYAAGLALERLAALAAQSSRAQIDAGIVSYDTKFERYMKLAAGMKSSSAARWVRRTWAF